MDLNTRVDVNCGQKDGRTENRTPISHLAKADKNNLQNFRLIRQKMEEEWHGQEFGGMHTQTYVSHFYCPLRLCQVTNMYQHTMAISSEYHHSA